MFSKYQAGWSLISTHMFHHHLVSIWIAYLQLLQPFLLHLLAITQQILLDPQSTQNQCFLLTLIDILNSCRLTYHLAAVRLNALIVSISWSSFEYSYFLILYR